mgnify:FL=1
MKEYTTGILLQGDIRSLTLPIIEECQQNFPNSEIILSTWDDQDISNIPCKVIQTKIPEPTHPFKSSKNYQIIGSRSGLNAMNSDLILKIRTDIFIHNPNIFDIFLAENSFKKIMYPHSGLAKENREYWIQDFCQLSNRKTLLNYWNLMPLHDGTTIETVERYLTRNYVLNICKDNRPWNITQNKYFIKKRFLEDFQLEFHKYVYLESHQDNLVNASNEEVSNNKLAKLLDATT